MRARTLCTILALLATATQAAAQDALPPGPALEVLPLPTMPNTLPPAPTATPEAFRGVPTPGTAPGLLPAAPDQQMSAPFPGQQMLTPAPGQQFMPSFPGQQMLPPGTTPNALPALPPGTTTLDGSMVPGTCPGDCCTLPEHINGPEDAPHFSDENLYRPVGRIWFRASYLHWWMKNAPTPPLLSISPGSSSSTSTVAVPAGVSSLTGLGGLSTFVPVTTTQGSTGPLLVGSPIPQQGQSGGRFNVGYSWDPQSRLSVEGDFLFLSEQSARFQPALTSSQTLSRPFYDPTTDTLTSLVLSAPGQATGTARITSQTEFFGGEVNLRYLLCNGPRWYTSFITGARVLELNERVEIDDSSTALVSDPSVRADVLARADRFRTRNFFYGGQAGLENEWDFDRLYLRLRGKVAAGITHQIVDINGVTVASDFGGPTFAPVAGGLLAQPSNIGHYSRDRFSVVPELGVDLGYWVTQHLRVDVGYTSIFWNSVARVGNQIDSTVNSSAISTTGLAAGATGPARPAFFFHDSQFWVQGVNFTLELRY